MKPGVTGRLNLNLQPLPVLMPEADETIPAPDPLALENAVTALQRQTNQATASVPDTNGMAVAGH